MIPVWVIALLAAPRRGVSGAAAAYRHDGHLPAAACGGFAGAADFEEKERTEALEPSYDRSTPQAWR